MKRMILILLVLVGFTVYGNDKELLTFSGEIDLGLNMNRSFDTPVVDSNFDLSLLITEFLAVNIEGTLFFKDLFLNFDKIEASPGLELQVNRFFSGGASFSYPDNSYRVFIKIKF